MSAFLSPSNLQDRTSAWLHDSSPTSAAAVCREHALIHMITAPHQRQPCVEDSALSLIQGDRVPSRCMKYTTTEKHAKVRGPDAPARKAREGEESPDTPTKEAREGQESHDTPARKSARRWRVTWRPVGRILSAFQISPDYYASYLRPYKWCSTRSYSIVSL